MQHPNLKKNLVFTRGVEGVARKPRKTGNRLSNLKELFIKENEISSLPETLIELNSLVKIDLEGNKLKKLPNNFIQIPSLKYINISRNKSLVLNAEQKRFIKKRDEEVY